MLWGHRATVTDVTVTSHYGAIKRWKILHPSLKSMEGESTFLQDHVFRIMFSGS